MIIKLVQQVYTPFYKYELKIKISQINHLSIISPLFPQN
jgi:hypothetical protein